MNLSRRDAVKLGLGSAGVLALFNEINNVAIPANIPSARLLTEEDLPFVPFTDEIDYQLLMVDLKNDYWIERDRFQPGTTLPRHRHTGEVSAFTIAGSWHYLEYPEEVNTAGSYLYEPIDSVHTLHVLDSNEGLTDVWFAIRGSILDLDEKDQVVYRFDAKTALDYYNEMCAKHGHGKPNVIIV
jgi:quercetin dioxygenase-like cupin family protein